MLETVTAMLAARDLHAAIVEDEGVRTLVLTDGDETVELNPEFGSPAQAADGLERAARAMLEYAEQIRYRHRMRTAGWT